MSDMWPNFPSKLSNPIISVPVIYNGSKFGKNDLSEITPFCKAKSLSYCDTNYLSDEFSFVLIHPNNLDQYGLLIMGGRPSIYEDCFTTSGVSKKSNQILIYHFSKFKGYLPFSSTMNYPTIWINISTLFNL
jgi:hypothetical protein